MAATLDARRAARSARSLRSRAGTRRHGGCAGRRTRGIGREDRQCRLHLPEDRRLSRPSARRSSTASTPASPTRRASAAGTRSIPTFVDDATDPAKAVAAVQEPDRPGHKIIAGTGSSGIALQLGPLAAQNNVLYIAGAAAADAITGLNRNTFRAGRQTLQDVLDAANIFPPKSTRQEDRRLRGGHGVRRGQRRRRQQRSSAARAIRSRRSSSPFGAADLTPYAQQLKNSGADAASSPGRTRPTRRDVAVAAAAGRAPSR